VNPPGLWTEVVGQSHAESGADLTRGPPDAERHSLRVIMQDLEPPGTEPLSNTCQILIRKTEALPEFIGINELSLLR
jgi:hypothetical protein